MLIQNVNFKELLCRLYMETAISSEINSAEVCQRKY